MVKVANYQCESTTFTAPVSLPLFGHLLSKWQACRSVWTHQIYSDAIRSTVMLSDLEWCYQSWWYQCWCYQCWSYQSWCYLVLMLSELMLAVLMLSVLILSVSPIPWVRLERDLSFNRYGHTRRRQTKKYISHSSCNNKKSACLARRFGWSLLDI